ATGSGLEVRVAVAAAAHADARLRCDARVRTVRTMAETAARVACALGAAGARCRSGDAAGHVRDLCAFDQGRRTAVLGGQGSARRLFRPEHDVRTAGPLGGTGRTRAAKGRARS